jgi:hypothetical protein
VSRPAQSKRERQRQRRQERRRVEARRRKAQRRNRLLAWIVAAVAVVGVVVLLATTVLRGSPPPEGTRDVAATARDHVQGAVDYGTVLPAGGAHAPIWQNCGFYDDPVVTENAVHSLEHGAVWLGYDPALPADARQSLRQLAGGHVLVSPVEGLEAPVVATAWGKQLATAGVDDPRLAQFVDAFADGSQAPEPGAACSGGTGEPSA